MHRLLVWLVLGSVVGCVPGRGVLGDTSAPADDTASGDTDPGDTDPGDTDPADTGTDPGGSGLPEGVPPGSDLTVEILWERAGDDMDLHLLAPEGRLEADSDCHYANCQEGTGHLDWGEAGDDGDDPVLLEEDIYGTGPEVIYIEAPADGTYTVVVHDYPGSVLEGANDVTTTVYLDGEAAWTDTRPIDGEDGYFDIAAITFPGGTVEALSGAHGAGR